MSVADDAVVLLTGGVPDRLTGGNLYNRHLCAGLGEAGIGVAAVISPPSAYPSVVLIDSIAIAETFPWVADRPRGCTVVALMHMLPSLHARTGEERLRWRRLEMAFLRHADLVVAASEDLANWLRRLEVPEGRLHVIPPGKDGPQPRPAGSLPHAQGLRVLCVANWFPVKNLDVLARACADTPDDVRLDLVGDTSIDLPYAGRVWETIRSHSLTARVRVHGAVPPHRLGALYGSADVFALASASEGYATVVAEALWFGLPVVATAVGGVPHLVAAGVEGYLVPPGRHRPLAEALRRLHDDAALRGRMAAAAAERGRSLPTWDDTRRALQQLFAPLLG